jgi:hypothetical protein
MNTITTLKKLAQKDNLVLIPRKEYEFLKEFKAIKEFAPTALQKRALVLAEKNLKRNKTLSYNELVHKLGFAS